MLVGLSWADAVGRSLRQSFFMFWATLWPLILGFGLSGAVQALVSNDAMRRRLGDHRPAAVARASAFGMLSSSCSYAATAMAKSLFVKGADLVAVGRPSGVTEPSCHRRDLRPAAMSWPGTRTSAIPD